MTPSWPDHLGPAGTKSLYPFLEVAGNRGVGRGERLLSEQLEQTSGGSRAWSELGVSWPEWCRALQVWNEDPGCYPGVTQP